MLPLTDSDIELYNQQFDNLNKLVGNSIDQIVLYLEPTDVDYSEQPNKYGKSLFNGIDIKVGNKIFSIGCRFSDTHYGLSISEGKTSDFEYIEEEKEPTLFIPNIVGKTIKSVEIYWMKIPWDGAVGFYPQEFVLKTESDFLLISSIEINDGEVDAEFTDELILIENEKVLEQFQLGSYGQGQNGRERFTNSNELFEAYNKNWL